jgi:hypothetical protein
MKKISVIEALTTSVLLSTDKGKSLFYLIVEELKKHDRITLDFSGYEYISTTFLNNSFGDLIVTYNWDFEILKKHIDIIGLSEDDIDELKLSVNNAKFKKNLIDKGLNPEEIYSNYTTI